MTFLVIAAILLTLAVADAGIYVVKRCNSALFAGTTWAGGNHFRQLKDLPGAEVEQRWIPGRGSQKAVLVPFLRRKGSRITAPCPPPSWRPA